MNAAIASGLNAPVGSIDAPAAQASVGQNTVGDATSVALDDASFRRLLTIDSILLASGGIAAAASVILHTVGRKRLGRAFGQVGSTVLLVGILRQLNALAQQGREEPTLH